MDYDAILIHPSAIHDFWNKAVFPGLLAYTVDSSTDQFVMPPIGIISIADYLDRNGYKVLVDNIGERMISDKKLNPEKHIKNLSARVFAVELHWCVHSQGAIEAARLCKKLHPEAVVVMGGLTATVFAEEIIRKFEFVDAVIRAEAEKPFVALMKVLEQGGGFEGVPNLTFRDSKGKVVSNPLLEPNEDLDEYEFTRLDLLEPQKAIFTPGMPSHWGIPICRGCSYNCVGCGGSAYSYKTYLGRKKPAFRSPKKIIDDLHKLSDQGVQMVFLFQDPRMGGEKYWRRLVKEIRNGKPELLQITMELFRPADEEYIRELSRIGMNVALSISPESLVGEVRRVHGRNYTNEELFDTLKLCKKYGIPLGVFSMFALAEDTEETIKETWKVWEQICALNKEVVGETPVFYSFGPMILLDPGSLAFDFPEKYGFSLIFDSFEDYYSGISLPSWHLWMSYETKRLDKETIARLFIESIEYSINLREKYGISSAYNADMARLYFVKANRLIMDMVDNAMQLEDEGEKLKKLKRLRKYIDKNIPYLEPRRWQ